MINESAQVLKQSVKAEVYPYSIILLALISLLGLIFITWAVKGNKRWGDMPKILLFFAVIMGLITTFLILMPNTLLELITSTKSFIGI